MKIVVIMFGTKKSRIVSSDDTHKVLYRPVYMVYATYNPHTKRYGKRRLVRLKHSRLPDDFISQIIDCNSAIVVWNNEDIAISKALLQESGVEYGTIKALKIKNILKTNKISYKTLSSASKDLGLKKCPRDGVTSAEKLMRRFVSLKRVFKALLILAKNKLFTEIIMW